MKRKKTRGFTDYSLTQLDVGLCRWLLPRLKRFKQIRIGHPFGKTEEEWDTILDEIIEALRLHTAPIPKKFNAKKESEEAEKVANGFKLLGEYLCFLWI